MGRHSSVESSGQGVGANGITTHDDAASTGTRASKSGHTDLARLYKKGKDEATGGHPEMAFASWLLAAQGLHISAMLSLAACYLKGEGTARDEIQATRLLIMAHILSKDAPLPAGLSPLAANCCQKLKGIIRANEEFGDIRTDFHQFEALVSVYMGLVEIYEYFHANQSAALGANQLIRRKNFAKLVNSLLVPQEGLGTYGAGFQQHLAQTQKSCANSLKRNFGSIVTILGGGKERYLAKIIAFDGIIRSVTQKNDGMIHWAALAFMETIREQAEVKEIPAAVTLLATQTGPAQDDSDAKTAVSWAQSSRTALTTRRPVVATARVSSLPVIIEERSVAKKP